MKKLFVFAVVFLCSFFAHSQPFLQEREMQVRYFVVDTIASIYDRILYTRYAESTVVCVKRVDAVTARVKLKNGAIFNVLDSYLEPIENIKVGTVYGYNEHVMQTVSDTTYVLLEVKTVSDGNTVLWKKENLMYVEKETLKRIGQMGLLGATTELFSYK